MAYGVPLVMNFTLAIPYIFINGIMLGIAWYLTVIGVLPRVAGVSTPAGMPIIISGFMQGSWKIGRIPIYRTFCAICRMVFLLQTADLVACREENQTDTIECSLKKCQQRQFSHGGEDVKY
ncbi:cellobiose-specific PTS family enzyme IIC component [Klebsiella pneumoniae]|uniref:Cellobiose-specific PTS family enzyme IIC component n=1 Tax=Klebsiella pneumoniae TaxID=573 RepID=A0A2X1QLN5_KLEPN|nr:cellobiose-specific PTS family enzyme IIC component [Klebsiella pneumoniae]